MTIAASPAASRTAARVRFALLAMVALLVGHDAVYAVEHGIDTEFGTAMTALGHDAYWGAFTTGAVLAAIGLAIGSIAAIARLHRRARRLPDRGARQRTGASYRRELQTLWPRLALATIVLFTIQENVETLLTRGAVPGVDVLLGGPVPLAIPVLIVIALVLAAVGALVRWRITTLDARLRHAAFEARPLLEDARPAQEWATVDASAPHRWIPDRPDAGRAPPLARPA